MEIVRRYRDSKHIEVAVLQIHIERDLELQRDSEGEKPEEFSYLSDKKILHKGSSYICSPHIITSFIPGTLSFVIAA